MAATDPLLVGVRPAGPLARLVGRAPRFTPEPGSLAGRAALVTGAAGGIGLEIARALSRAGARVILVARTEARAAEAVAELDRDRRPGDGELEGLGVDLARPEAIRVAAAGLRVRLDALHLLVNNAGVCLPSRTLTPDGFEATWATNVLAYHLLVQELLPLLKRSAPARVVDVSSTYAGDLDLDDLAFERRPYSAGAAYRQSKQAERMLAWVRAQELAGSGVTINVAHPGWVTTGITRHLSGLARAGVALTNLLFGRSPAVGAETPVWLAASPGFEGRSDGFYAWLAPRACEFRDDPRLYRLRELVELQAEAGG